MNFVFTFLKSQNMSIILYKNNTLYFENGLYNGSESPSQPQFIPLDEYLDDIFFGVTGGTLSYQAFLQITRDIIKFDMSHLPDKQKRLGIEIILVFTKTHPKPPNISLSPWITHGLSLLNKKPKGTYRLGRPLDNGSSELLYLVQKVDSRKKNGSWYHNYLLTFKDRTVPVFVIHDVKANNFTSIVSEEY